MGAGCIEYFYELFESLPRQGPGCEAATLRALALVRPGLPARPRALDIGCGSGLPTLTLARELETKVLAIDSHRPLLACLDRAASEQGLEVEARELSMTDMRFAPESFDLLWAEGWAVIDTFQLPDSAWWDDYHTPMLGRIRALRLAHPDVAEAEAVYAACEREAGMFRRHSRDYGYAFFVLRRG